MKRAISFVLFLMVVVPSYARGEEIIKKDQTLTLEQCIDIALKRQPTILAAAYTVMSNESGVGQAVSTYYPQVGLSAGYSRNYNAAAVRTIGSAAVIPSSLTNVTSSHFDQYSAAATLTQLIYDFGKTASTVDIAKLAVTSSRSDLETTTELQILAVKQAYYGVLEAERNRVVAIETVREMDLHLAQAKGFYAVGTHPKFDVTTAEVNLSNAKLNLIQVENSLRIAKVTLNNAMGVPDAPTYSIEDNLSYVAYIVSMDEAIAKAYANRPDLLSIIAKRQSAERSIDLAKTGYYPSLTSGINYGWTGDNFPLQNGWNVGVSLNFPLFSGFLTKYQVDQARANLNVAKENEDSLRLSVLLDVQQSFLNLKQAEESIPTTELTVRQASENLELANGRYAAGVGSPIEVTDAEVAYSNAKTAYNQALYSYKIAQASLEKAMGRR
ncbi:MAG: TolC family protein [Dissulfurispiraceae bacterium]